MDILTSIRGKRLGLGEDGSLVLEKGGTQRLFPITRIVNATAATLTVTKDAHAGRLITLNRAGGIAVTLPAATGSGDPYEFLVGTTFTSDGTIKVVGDDTMAGTLAVSTDAAGVVIPTGATSDTITMNGTTTGGVKGSYVKLIDVAADLWAVSGGLVSTGVEATPFSATVS